MEHTKLPWKTSWWIPRQGRKIMASSRCVAIVQTNKKDVLEADPKAEANAEYIVRACNAFPAMEALVEQYVVVLEEGHPQPINKNCDCVVCRVRVKAKAALAAGGE